MIESNTIVTCSNEGKYKVLGFISGSRTIVEILDIERGEGWSEYRQRYIGVKHYNEKGRQTAWSRSENHCYGEVRRVHKKYLNIYNSNKLKV